MRYAALSSLPFLFLATPLLGQELITNGTFTGSISPWVMGGAYSVNPGFEAGKDVTGMGISDSFGVNAGGQVTPPPYAPNTLEQTVNVVAGLTYEFRMDALGYRNSTTSNADIGTIWVELNGVEIARFAFGGYVSPEQKRAQLCGRHVPAVGGPVQLVLFFERGYLAGSVNPRMNIDNASLIAVDGPTFCVRGNRKLGDTIDFVVEGAPGAPYAVYIASARLPFGIAFPPLTGELWLDPTANLVQFLSGGLDPTGLASTSIPIPLLQPLRVVPIHYQALAALPPTLGFSLPTALVMTQ